EDLDDAIALDQGHNVRHEPVDVAKHSPPFLTAKAEEISPDALAAVQREEIIPAGFSVGEAEWEDGMYCEIEVMKVGRKESQIVLPFRIWWPRAVAWAQGLKVMSRLQSVENGDLYL
ncbi:hypothetical protein DFH09DRAFT_959148, partial [Mycena vulgaris]